MTRADARRARRIEAKRRAKAARRDLLVDAVYWRADGEAMWRGKPLFAPLPKPRPGYAFINANCKCWRHQFSNLFCSKCTPIDWREVPHDGGGS
jgi:hypothetical protein